MQSKALKKIKSLIHNTTPTILPKIVHTRKDVARDKEEGDGRTLTSHRFTSFHHHEHLIHSSTCNQLPRRIDAFLNYLLHKGSCHSLNY